MQTKQMESVAIFLLFSMMSTYNGASAADFSFINHCDFTVWPGVLSNPGSATLETSGFKLSSSTSRSLHAPEGWSGRFWARTDCNFDISPGNGSCATGDCRSGSVECNGAGALPPATLAEFTLGTGGGKDFYDVSLVDGYNIQMMVTAVGCQATGCIADLNHRCPDELRAAGKGAACMSACFAFRRPEYCCTGDHGSPDTCKPTSYSQIFKTSCPNAYSYAYDDATSIFTCAASTYTMAFCPSLRSVKSSQKHGDMEEVVLVGRGSDQNMINGVLGMRWTTGLLHWTIVVALHFVCFTE